ncbi:MAG TPA: ribonuclease HI family protein [Candidatus Dormibacteraeota bacterium]|nr:ribonuclease HI family protein [Candidatus Dormibacteraeota bacterium]
MPRDRHVVGHAGAAQGRGDRPLRQLRPDPGDRLKTLRLRTDGAARDNPGPAGAGILIEDEHGVRLQARHKWLGQMTNNQAEYHALIEGIKAVKPWMPDRLEIYLDSNLVVEQVKGNYKIKEPELQRLNAEVRRLLADTPYEIKHVAREQNRGADHLANMAIDEKMPKKKFGG